MKTERRHELQTNVLADALAHWIEAARPYGRVALAALIVLALVAGGLVYQSSQERERLAKSSDEYFSAFGAGNRDKLTDVADNNPGTPVAIAARLAAADIWLAEGTGQLYRDRVVARQNLKQAVDNYQAVLADATDPGVRENSLYGLARAHESLGDLAQARESYQKLLDESPKGVYSAAAKQRLDDLGKDSVKEFYDWFATHDPRRVMSGAPGTPGQKFDFLNESLDRPGEFKLPSVTSDLKPFAEPAATDGKDNKNGITTPGLNPADEKKSPASGSSEKDGEKGGAKTPDAKPSPDEKSSGEPPAEKTPAESGSPEQKSPDTKADDKKG